MSTDTPPSLRLFLEKLGFTESNGAYRHPEGRRVIFLGDYINRGPAIRRVLQIVRGMVEAETALALLGNHEVSALRYHAADTFDATLRPSAKYLALYKTTLNQMAEPAPEEWRDWLAWFSRLPLWIDLGGLRAVHAAWDQDAIAALRNIGPLEGAVLEQVSRKGTADYAAISNLVEGPQAKLAGDEGSPQKSIRIRWWDGKARDNARDAIYPSDPTVPPVPIVSPRLAKYEASEPPVFFGHYCTTPKQSIVAPNAACLDFGAQSGSASTHPAIPFTRFPEARSRNA